MAKQTKAEQVAAKLLELGAREVTTTSRKYRRFDFRAQTYWVGKAGAVRVGKTITDSFSVSDQFHMALKRIAEKTEVPA